MSQYKPHIAFFLLLLFSVMQFADLHSLGHDDESDDCAICHFCVEKSEHSYLTHTAIAIPEYTEAVVLVPLNFYVSEHYTQNTTWALRNKAPPVS